MVLFQARLKCNFFLPNEYKKKKKKNRVLFFIFFIHIYLLLLLLFFILVVKVKKYKNDKKKNSTFCSNLISLVREGVVCQFITFGSTMLLASTYIAFVDIASIASTKVSTDTFMRELR